MTKIKKALSYASAAAFVFSVSPFSVFAQDINLVPPSGPGKAVSDFTPQALLRTGINLILITAGLITFFFLLLGGIQWITAGGDKEGTEKARKKITAALIGLAIVFSAYAIAFLVKQIFGIDLISITIPSVSTQQ